MSPFPAIHYDPRLMEDALFHAQRRGQATRVYDNRRKRIYEIGDPDERERLFLDLNRNWFYQLGLSKPVEDALHEQPLIAAQVDGCFIVCATQARDESAELFVAQEAQPEQRKHTLRLLLRPESLLDPGALKSFLRHELFHIADMLDPAFEYEPALPGAPAGPTHDRLIADRYRVLWDVTINGRMMRRGWCDGSLRDQQFDEFARAFPMLHEGTAESFGKFFDVEQPRHADLVRFAFDPRAAGDKPKPQAAPGSPCPLCKFPTHAYEPEPNALGADLLAAIKEDFPNWAASRGLCTQCADLYRGRRLSMAALRILPGCKPAPSRA